MGDGAKVADDDRASATDGDAEARAAGGDTSVDGEEGGEGAAREG